MFNLERVGPWINFDVRPVYRAIHAARWSPWQPLIDSLNKFSNDFFDFRRDQGTFEKRAPIK
jgi:hypothetical protein